jgi:hypothetical protein
MTSRPLKAEKMSNDLVVYFSQPFSLLSSIIRKMPKRVSSLSFKEDPIAEVGSPGALIWGEGTTV